MTLSEADRMVEQMSKVVKPFKEKCGVLIRRSNVSLVSRLTIQICYI